MTGEPGPKTAIDPVELQKTQPETAAETGEMPGEPADNRSEAAIEEQDEKADENTLFGHFLRYAEIATIENETEDAEAFWDNLVKAANEDKLFVEDDEERAALLEEIHTWLSPETQAERYKLPDYIEDDDLDQSRLDAMATQANKFYLEKIIDGEVTAEQAQELSHKWFVGHVEAGSYLTEESDPDTEVAISETTDGTVVADASTEATELPAHSIEAPMDLDSATPLGSAKAVRRVGHAATSGTTKDVKRVGLGSSAKAK